MGRFLDLGDLDILFFLLGAIGETISYFGLNFIVRQFY